jgi:hypothetical protein
LVSIPSTRATQRSGAVYHFVPILGMHGTRRGFLILTPFLVLARLMVSMSFNPLNACHAAQRSGIPLRTHSGHAWHAYPYLGTSRGFLILTWLARRRSLAPAGRFNPLNACHAAKRSGIPLRTHSGHAWHAYPYLGTSRGFLILTRLKSNNSILGSGRFNPLNAHPQRSGAVYHFVPILGIHGTRRGFLILTCTQAGLGQQALVGFNPLNTTSWHA